MKKMVQKFRNNLNNVREDEAGDVIQNVLVIAVFVIIVGVVGKILYDAIKSQGDATAKCIGSIGKNVTNANAASGKGCK